MADVRPLVNNQSIALQDESITIQGNSRNTELKVFIMSHLIFRGDSHNNPVLSEDPKFYGTLTSAFNYASPYLKIYQPVKELRLLSLNFTATNVQRINNMFQDLIGYFTASQQQNNVRDLQILYIFLQINFGLIVPPVGHTSPYFYGINKMGYSNDGIRDAIRHYTRSDSASAFVFNLLNACDTNQNIPLNGRQISARQLIGSRMSIRPMDQWIVAQLKIYLPHFFTIDGIIFDDTSMTQNLPFVCRFATEVYGGETCVPTEVCIFTPRTSLALLSMVTKNDRNQINRSGNAQIDQMLGLQGVQLIGGNLGKYEKLYHKYKNKYLNLKNKLNI